MRSLFLHLLLIALTFFFSQPAFAKSNTPTSTATGTIACFSGGQEILRREIVSGPFADEYKYAHEVTVIDSQKERSLNFTGGLCIIDRGAVSLKKEPPLTDSLNCYSGAKQVISFSVRGQESTVDEYVEGRTFIAQAKGIAFNTPADSLHEYLVFGNEACIGEEVD